MIHFRECPDAGYKPRTIENASADATIAFAIDFYTAGEILTRNSVREQGKVYYAVTLGPAMPSMTDILFCSTIFNKHKVQSLNIAGNGIYTMKNKIPQEVLDEKIYEFLRLLFLKLDNPIAIIRSGGQTGADEAGIKAAERLGIDSLVYAPKGWRFRGMDGDIADEAKFKERFIINGV